MVGSEVLLMKSKHQYHLSQWGECVYGSQSWKKKRLLRESVFILFDKWNLILKNGVKWSFSCEAKAIIHLSEWGEWVYGTQSWEERRLLYKSMFILIDIRTLILKNARKEVFLMKLEHQYHLSQW